jgi:hypothetical protein
MAPWPQDCGTCAQDRAEDGMDLADRGRLHRLAPVAQELEDPTPRRSAVVLLAGAGTTRGAAMPHLTARRSRRSRPDPGILSRIDLDEPEARRSSGPIARSRRVVNRLASSACSRRSFFRHLSPQWTPMGISLGAKRCQ